MKLDLGSFEKALASLGRALVRAQAAPEDEELRDACIQRFGFSFELAWKMLKRRLVIDLPGTGELDGMNYRTLIRTGAEQGLLDDVSARLIYRDKGNLTSHTYDEKKAKEVYAVIPAFAAHAGELFRRLHSKAVEDA
ncbi:MAG: HI0074 family nucleotidyltransferase substrate-binding subunit [Erythrobacter tepidarius]